MADEDRTDEVLKSLGEVTRRRTAESSSTAGPECVEEDRLRALGVGRLPEAEAEAVSSHLAGCARCRRLLALMATERRELEPARLEAIVAHAVREVRAGSAEPAGVRASAGRDGWRELFRWPILVPVAAAALLVLWVGRPLLFGPSTESETVASAWAMQLSGGEQRFQGALEPSGLELPTFVPTSRVRLVLEPANPSPDAEGAAVTPVVLVHRADGTLVRVDGTGGIRIESGPGGILIEGDGEAFFGRTAGPVAVWGVIASRDDLPSASMLTGEPARVSAELEAGAATGRWWFGRREARYSLAGGP